MKVEMPDGDTLTILGAVEVHLAATASVDYRGLGAWLADATSEQQAEMLSGLAIALSEMEGGALQMAFIGSSARHIGGADRIGSVLTDLADYMRDETACM